MVNQKRGRGKGYYSQGKVFGVGDDPGLLRNIGITEIT